MSEIKRLTLISDPTDEFPNNANNSFKVRLPERLSLPGEGWHASLMSLTVPDQGQSNAIIAADPHTKVIRFDMTYVIRKWVTGEYRFVNVKTVMNQVELETIMNASQIVTTGSMFWKRVMQEVHNNIMHNVMGEQKNWLISDPDKFPIVSVKKSWMPRLSWKDDSLVIHAIPKGDVLKSDKTLTTTKFLINLDVALKFGLVDKKTGQNKTWYELGPNMQFTLPSETYTNDTKPDNSNPVHRAAYNWNGEQYMGVQPSDMFIAEVATDKPFKVVTMSGLRAQTTTEYVQLSLLVEWQLNNLDASFEKIVGTRKRTVMVYSDLVESTVVGSGKYPLLREVQLLRTGDGESTAEPLHHQWIKLRGQQLDILEVEIASTSGPLAVLPPGKTLVTIGLKKL